MLRNIEISILASNIFELNSAFLALWSVTNRLTYGVESQRSNTSIKQVVNPDKRQGVVTRAQKHSMPTDNADAFPNQLNETHSTQIYYSTYRGNVVSCNLEHLKHFQAHLIISFMFYF